MFSFDATLCFQPVLPLVSLLIFVPSVFIHLYFTLVCTLFKLVNCNFVFLSIVTRFRFFFMISSFFVSFNFGY